MHPLPIFIPYSICASAYLALAGLILLQARRSRTGLLLAATAAVTALWAAVTAAPGQTLAGVAACLDLLHLLAWYGLVLHLYRRTVAPAGGGGLFMLLGIAGLLAAATTVLSGNADAGGQVSLLSPAILLRLALAIALLLLLENLYRSTAPERRWHIGLACVAIGGPAAYDVALWADAALFRVASPVLLAGRAVAGSLVTPLLALAAARNRGWKIDIHVSRTAAFHSATLVVSGLFLLALAAAGELARRFGGAGRGWGDVADVGLLFAGLLTIAVLLTSGSARARLRRGVVDHFFTHRFDYRREWLRSIGILAGADGAPLASRVVRALAEPVDCPAGLLFTRVPGQPGLAWAGGWNHAPVAALPPDHPLLVALADAEHPVPVDAAMLDAAPTRTLRIWLAAPLREQGLLTGAVLLAPPRTAFRLDDEVFDLLRILAREVTTHLAEQRATRSLLEGEALRDYGERFAFVAHDIKNVASQLSLLLANAEVHLANPAFQADMLVAVRASVAKITALIRRLQPAEAVAASPEAVGRHLSQASADPAEVLAAVAARPTGGANVELDLAAAGLTVPMDPAALEAAVIHLLDNAATAAGYAGTVRLVLRAEAGRAVVEITDDGPGMTVEFIRDELFRPFATTRPGGSGIGAYQARALVRAAGGDLAVASQPGAGTTVGISLPIRIVEPTS